MDRIKAKVKAAARPKPASKLRTALAIGLILALQLTAQTPNAVAQHMNAVGAACQQPASEAETTQCLINAAKQADEKLNATFVEIEKLLESQHRTGDEEALRTAQRLWIEFRKANCEAARALYGKGTAGPTNYWACIESQTRRRVEDLTIGYGWVLKKFGRQL